MAKGKRKAIDNENMIKDNTKKETKTSHLESSLTRVLEKGHVFFFYRPKVEVSEEEQHQIKSLNDVAKFYMLLSPTSSCATNRVHTLLIMTGKMLPRLAQHDRRGAFVDLISPNLSEILNVLGEREYDTKVTHEHRFSPPARPCGEGLYEIIHHGSSPKHAGHSHFIYELEVPIEPGPCQHAFHITGSGSFEVSLKNPNISPTDDSINKGLGPKQKAHYTQDQLKHFKGKRVDMLRWASLDPSFLNIQHSELLFIGLSQDLRSEEHLDYMSPPSPFTEELEKLQHEEMQEAQIEFGKGNEYEKLYLDLELPEVSDVLGPNNSVRTGEFA